MAAREGMTQLIQELRLQTHSGTADFTAGTVDYFTDDHLQAVLDRHRTLLRHVPLEATPQYTASGYVYQDCVFPYEIGQHVEREGAASDWALRDVGGADAPSHSVNYDARTITFDASTGGATYYLDVHVYDLNMAAAAVWEQKAGLVALNVDWSSDNLREQARQEQENYLRMAGEYRQKAGLLTIQMLREDEA